MVTNDGTSISKNDILSLANPGFTLRANLYREPPRRVVYLAWGVLTPKEAVGDLFPGHPKPRFGMCIVKSSDRELRPP